MSSPIKRGRVFSRSVMTAFRSTTLGAWTCLRLKASNCRVSWAARRAAASISFDLAFKRTAWRPSASERKLGVAGDDRQQIIEVVRDSSREATDCVHLLALQELRFQAQAFREIAPVGNEMGDHSGIVTNGADALLDVIRFTVLFGDSPGCCGTHVRRESSATISP